MSEWKIYGSDGIEKALVKDLELHDEWMAECYLTITVKSAEPVNFAIGDYIDYRGERYCINYDPTVLKKARRGTYGEGFTYDNIKFSNDAQNKVVTCDFTDIVLNDNKLHYTSLPTFPFYCETVDDLLDRIQACLEELYPGEFVIIGLNTARNEQRGQLVGREQAFVDAYKQYVDPQGYSNTQPYGKIGVAMTADNISCWDAVTKIHEDFDLNFIQRGNVIVAGTTGTLTPSTFRYGKGKGLYELERICDSSKQIVTRLRAYGSENNIPSRYYATLNMQCFGTVTKIEANYATSGIHYAAFLLDLDFAARLFNNRSVSYPGSSENPNYIVEIRANDITVKGYVSKDYSSNNCYVYCEFTGTNPEDDRDETDESKMNAFSEAIKQGDTVYFVNYINKDAWPKDHSNYATENLPNNMAINRLMLPGFPNQSLYDWVKAHGGTGCDDATGQATISGFTGIFSKDKHRPWIQSMKAEEYGVRPASIYFDGSDETTDIHPTIEEMTYNGVRVDEILSADQITDNGVYDTDDPKNFTITLPNLGFELDKVYQDGASIDMKDGMCGARSFKMASRPKKNASGNWVCEVQRAYDDSLSLWFPYSDFQIRPNDHYVLIGIDMPDAYVDAAAEKLFGAAIEALQKNDKPTYTYQPRIDEIWMQRQHDSSIGTAITSIHDTIKAGDIFAFEDEDLGIDCSIIIDVLTIRENGNNGLPTYEVTLRDEKQVSAIQKMIDKAVSSNSVNSGNGGSGNGYNGRQVQSAIENYGSEYYISKVNDDTANGEIGFLKGLWIKIKGLFGIDSNGNAKVNDINVAGDANFEGFLQAVKAMMNQISSLNYTGGDFGTGFMLTNDRNGHSYLAVDELYVRMKAIFNELEIKKRTYCGGNFIFSPAGSKLYRVDYINASGETIGYAEYNVPWVLNGEAITLNDIAYAARQKVRVEVDLSSVATYRCYIVSDDGSTTIENLWKTYDQAMCQTFDVKTSERDLSNEVQRKSGNIFYWRLVTGIGTAILDDGKEYAYVDLSNTNPGVSGGYLPTGPNGADADFPCAGDTIVCMGHRGSDADGNGAQRMNVIEVETVGDDAPAIKEYRGINTFSLEGKRKTMISPTSGNEYYAKRFYTETDYSEPVPNTIERGIWQQYDAQGQPMKYYYYDLASHKGTTWLCIVEDGVYESDGIYTFTDIEGKTWNIAYKKGDRKFTCLEPSDANNTVWQKHTWKGASSYKSTVFIRQNTTPTAPTAAETTVGGIKYNTYDHPVPPPSSGWTDGTPDGEAILWAVTRIFTTDGSEPQQASWSTPRPMTDTADFDVEFSSYENPSAPSGHPNTNSQWSNTANSSTIWMATSEKHNGVWGAWQISKIKGESGIDAAVASLSHSVISIQCDNSGKALASGSEDVYVYLSTKGSDLTGINHSVSGSTSATYRKLGGNRFRLSWSSGDSISDGTLTVTVTGTDSNGNSQSGYASIRVVAEKQGIKGTDAYSVNATPAALIFTQSETAPYGLVEASKTSTVSVIQGTQPITSGVTITLVEASGCDKNNIISGMNLIIKPTPTGNPTDGYKYPETGYAKFKVNVGGYDYEVTIQFACNLLGTWKRSVIGDVQTEIAQKTTYSYEDDNGNTHTFNVTEHLGEYVKSSTQNISTLAKTVNGIRENYSTITQTDSKISAIVSDLKTKTGIDITNGTIDLIAGKVNFKASDGATANPYMSIGQDGKLTVNSVKATDGEFSGKVTATEGEIGGWKINGNTLQSENKASIILNGNGNSFARIQPMSSNQPALSIRNDGGTAASFSAYTNNSIGIDVIAQSGYNTKAIHSSGNVEFNIRQGEKARFMSEGNKGTVQFDIPITFGSTPTLLYSTGTVNLPSSPVDGQFVFIKASRVYTPNKVYSNDSLTDIWIEANNSRDIGGASLIMVYSQSLESWIMFWCGWND